ncbi:MAG: glutaredoxin [Myxococcales bacterium]|nr:MAG: glutaredoxin [Myxococcales bacterium]
MALLRDEDRLALEKEFSSLGKKVKLLFFTQELNCDYCPDAKRILDEVGAISPNVAVREVNPALDGDTATRFGVDKIPAIVVTDEAETRANVRFFGLPAGYEFMSLISAILREGTDTVELSEETQAQVKAIDKPVHIQVFVTPSCPYCPSAVVIGQQMARLNPNITADMVEATEFPDLSRKYRVMGVPRVVINETTHFEGAQPEAAYLAQVLKAANQATVTN